MKKFRLIKTYPNSCSLGTVFTQHEDKSLFCADFCNGKNVGRRFSTDWELEYFIKNSEYFEEVIEKDYEILDWYVPKCCWHMEQEAPDCIKSVKRLSDGEVL